MFEKVSECVRVSVGEEVRVTTVSERVRAKDGEKNKQTKPNQKATTNWIAQT